MTRRCIAAIHEATQKVFTDEEASDVVDRLVDRARQAKKADPTASEQAAVARAAGELTREEVMSALIAHRLRAASEVAKAYRQAKIDAMPKSMTPAKRLLAFYEGSERQGVGTSDSIDARARARVTTRLGLVKMGLDQMPGLTKRLSNFWLQGEKGLDYKIADEMARLTGDGSIEPTGDEGALHAARVLAKGLEDTRQAQNAVGGFIGKLEGYVAKQSHDPRKIAGGYYRELGEVARKLSKDGLKDVNWQEVRTRAAQRPWKIWRDYQLANLHPKTFEGLELEDVNPKRAAEAAGLHAAGMIDNPEDLRELMLYHAFADIITGNHEEMTGAADHADFRPPASLARDVSKARVFIYKNPRSWIDYNRKFGSGSLLRTVITQLERGEKNAELMRSLGPSPEAGHQGEISRLSAEARAAGAPHQIKDLTSSKVKAVFEGLTGRLNAPENLRLAATMSTLRRWEGLSKLGAIVLSKFTDVPLSGQVMARAGAKLLDGYKGSFSGILRLGGQDAKAAAESLHVGARSFAGHIGGQYSEADGALGWTSYMTRLLYRVNGFDWGNNGVRKGIAQAWSHHMGGEAGHAWDALQIGTRETMERFGIGAEDWEAARKGLPVASDGNRYFTLDHIEDIPDSKMSPAAKSELKLRFLTMAHNIFDDSTSEPRLREQVAMAWGGKPGTAWGEVARSFSQMKGFLTAVAGRHVIPASRGYAGRTPVALLAHLFVATTIAGFFSMNAKLIAKGQAPRSPFNEDGTPNIQVWGAAMAQGAGLGIFGDFLVGEKNRNGLDFGFASAGGPLVSDAELLIKTIFQATHGHGDPLPGELTRLAVHNVPFSNLFYASLAFNYFVFWRLEEAVSPGYLRRFQRTVENQEDGHFIVSPTSAEH